MLIDIDQNRYEQVTRTDVLGILAQAQIYPDELIAHRNRSFTASYHRERIIDFRATEYEARIEAADYRVAIFKRPSPETDKGKYITLKFAVACAQALGINNHAEAHNDKEVLSSAALLTRLNGVSRDMRQLVQYANDVASNGFSHKHLAITLDELQKQIDLLTEGLNQLSLANTAV